MKSLVGGLIGLMLSVHVGAEPLLEGRVRLSSGQPAVGVQVRLADLTDLRRFVGTTTDETGHFALPLRAFSTARGTALPTDFALGQNYPNPFNPSTIIPYQLPSAGQVRLDVFNVLGQRLATLVDAEQSAGMHTAQWDGTDAAGRAMGAGVYIYRLSSGRMTESRRMVLVDGQAGIPAVALGPVQAEVEETAATDLPVYGLTVSGDGLVAYVDPAFRVGVDAADIVLEEHGGSPRMKLTTDRILGDVNNDGQVNAFDALYVLLYSEDSSIALPNNGDISLGDVNGDGQVDLADAVLLATYSVNPSDPTLPPGIGQAAPEEPSVGETSEDQDTALSHIYWIEDQSIRRANLDGSNIETIATIEDKISNSTFDVDEGKIYWTVSEFEHDRHKIRRANLDGSNIETIVISKDELSAIALDMDGGKVYWGADSKLSGASRTISGTGSPSVRRANLDGSNIETIATIEGRLHSIALDMEGGKIYWADTDHYELRRANLDGSNIETLVTGATSSDLALDVDGGKIYWTNWGNIGCTDLDGSNTETLVTGLSALDIALDIAGSKIYWTDRDNIWRANLDGSNTETLTTGLDARIYSIALGPYYELADLSEIQTRSREEARSELAERGIPYSQSSFITYAQNGDLDVVRLFVEAGLDVNVQPHSSSGMSILGQQDVEQLDDLEAGWFPQDGDEYNDTALIKAAGQGHREVVHFLVEQGADLNIRNNQGQNALMFAAASGHLAVVIFLIDSGASATSRGFFYSYEDGPYTPLMWAAYGGHLDVVQVLLENGASSSSAAMAWAAYRGHLDVVQVLLENGAQINPRAGSGITALMFAAYGGQLEVVRLLLENGADIHIRIAEWLPVESDFGNIYFQDIGPSALTLAIKQGHAEVVRLLLEHWMWEYSADGRDDYGITILMYAAIAGDIEMTRLLLENGALINAQTDNGITALIYAVSAGHVEVTRLLLENGAPINTQIDGGITALMYAASAGHVEVTRLLLENGAPINAQTDNGITALIYAVSAGHVEVTRLLLENGAPINAQTDGGITVLMYAASAGHVEVTRLLLENGAPINAQTDNGITALMYAANDGDLEMVRFLVESGADIHIQSANGYTALDLAEAKGHQEVVDFLRSAGDAG